MPFRLAQTVALSFFLKEPGQGDVRRTNPFGRHGQTKYHLMAEKQRKNPAHRTGFSGADYGARTRHLDLGKVALYQMS